MTSRTSKISARPKRGALMCQQPRKLDSGLSHLFIFLRRKILPVRFHNVLNVYPNVESIDRSSSFLQTMSSSLLMYRGQEPINAVSADEILAAGTEAFEDNIYRDVHSIWT